mgnify:CR=1 FL=1
MGNCGLRKWLCKVLCGKKVANAILGSWSSEKRNEQKIRPEKRGGKRWK